MNDSERRDVKKKKRQSRIWEIEVQRNRRGLKKRSTTVLKGERLRKSKRFEKQKGL